MEPLRELKYNGLCEEVLDGISDPIIVIKEDYSLEYANKAVLGKTRCVKASGQKCYALLHGLDAPCVPCACMEVFKSAKPYRVISKAGTTDGQSTSKEYSAYPILGENGRVSRVIEFVHDLPLIESRSLPENKTSSALGEEGASFYGMIGSSKKMRALFQLIRLVSPSSATILVYGKSGTGKERVARAIHSNSPRRNRPFVAIDCGALPETLLESELFGHVKGAFTGAIQNKKGLFEEAEGGTLFLDEIGDTSLVFQSKLLRALQEGEARPVGGNRSSKINVRMVAATNKSLKEAIAKKTFREDLYYRLAVMPIVIPPLHERLDDIPLLVEHFIKKYTARNRKGPMFLSGEAIELLKSMPWTGNVRELENVIERGVLVSPTPEITPESLLIEEEGGTASHIPSASLFSSTREALSKVERERIIDSLQRCNGNKSLAARSLGISRASLYNKLKRYQIPASI
ncbi:MAG: sigma-54 interaction domain-containing protein [Nitrospiria bacterium]